MSQVESTNDVAALTVQLLSAYLANNTVASQDIAGLIRTTREALTGEQVETQPEPETFTPAVSVRKSLASPEHIISLIDGRPYKTLKRHLASHGLTPDAYRSRYNLPASYPTVAPAYADKRREVAQQLGLSRKKAEATDTAATAAPQSTQTEVPSASEQQEKPVANKRACTSAPHEAATGRRAKSKTKAVGASEAAAELPAATQDIAAVEQSAEAAQKPKRRAKLGVFKKSDDERASAPAAQAEASPPPQGSIEDVAAAAEPAKRKSPKRMARGTASTQTDQPGARAPIEGEKSE